MVYSWLLGLKIWLQANLSLSPNIPQRIEFKKTKASIDNSKLFSTLLCIARKGREY